MDSVILHLQHAYNKRDYNISQQELVELEIKGKLGSWINDVLTDRSFKAVAHGREAAQEHVLSEILQETVLSPVVAFIMLYLDEYQV